MHDMLGKRKYEWCSIINLEIRTCKCKCVWEHYTIMKLENSEPKQNLKDN